MPDETDQPVSVTKAPRGTLLVNFWRPMFGLMLLVIIASLAAIIALGKVHQETSYGLEYLLGSLSALAGGFTQWAFGTPHKDPPDEKKP